MQKNHPKSATVIIPPAAELSESSTPLSSVTLVAVDENLMYPVDDVGIPQYARFVLGATIIHKFDALLGESMYPKNAGYESKYKIF